MAAAVGLDVGGGAVKAGAALLLGDGRLRPEGSEATARHGLADDGPGLAALSARLAGDVSARVRSAHPGLPLAWGVAAAAWIDPASGASVFSPHLPGWRGADLPGDLSRALAGLGGPAGTRAATSGWAGAGGGPAARAVPVPSVLNDADAAAWAEARTGAPLPAGDRMVMVAIGTGIGGALVRDGAVDVGAHGMAGEYGHMSVDPGGGACPCGNTGCWELVVSAGALAARSGHRSARTALDGALAGDPACRSAVAETGRWLGRGLATLAAVLDPSRIVVGGGIAAAGELLLEPARAELARRLPGARHRPVPGVTAARLGNRAGWLGAAGVALERAGRPVSGIAAG
ncbi:ROK family protein [Citricoccus sp. SGAir0253]|uniref:ROK family protein n=1 Tax=Citricoccus sp. SGAir0253 TaxID=2567881 RepID=UPI001FF068EC|nr:ROK family protein [Citricoccus sp. SGAir0253]